MAMSPACVAPAMPADDAFSSRRSTCTCCTGAATSRWPRRCGVSSSCSRRVGIRHWGVSNFDVGDLEELQRVAGAQACAANQVYYSLSERGVEFDLLPRMRALRMPLMAYSPIDGGRILRNAKLAKLAESLNLSAAQLSLAWLLRQPGVMAIPKAGREPHLFENWQSRDVTLPQQVLSELETVFAKPSRKHPLAMR
jgi:diketogulonate reductase-like aldo/keto reductase